MGKTDRIRDHYEPRISARHAHFDVVNWASETSQRARFAVLADHVALEGRSLLDLGCGLGDLWAYLVERRIPVRYTGIDILERMVEAARRAHPQARFRCADVFAPHYEPPETFDVVFCSGLFNLDLGNNTVFLARGLKRMAELSHGVVVCCLLHFRAAHDQRRYFHYDPAEVTGRLEAMGFGPRLIEGYLPNDFTVIYEGAG